MSSETGDQQAVQTSGAPASAATPVVPVPVPNAPVTVPKATGAEAETAGSASGTAASARNTKPPRMALAAFCARILRTQGPAVAAVFRCQEQKSGHLFDTAEAYQARLSTYMNAKA